MLNDPRGVLWALDRLGRRDALDSAIALGVQAALALLGDGAAACGDHITTPHGVTIDVRYALLSRWAGLDEGLETRVMRLVVRG